MDNLDKFDNLYAELPIIKHFRYFVFVSPGENILDALHVCFYEPDHPEQSLKIARRSLPDYVPDGVYAVFIHDQCTDSYIYYKTIKYRRKSFALSSDSE